LGLQTLSWKAREPQKSLKKQRFDVRFAFALPSLCFSIAFVWAGEASSQKWTIFGMFEALSVLHGCRVLIDGVQ
jgi:hypothetical protein